MTYTVSGGALNSTQSNLISLNTITRVSKYNIQRKFYFKRSLKCLHLNVSVKINLSLTPPPPV